MFKTPLGNGITVVPDLVPITKLDVIALQYICPLPYVDNTLPFASLYTTLPSQYVLTVDPSEFVCADTKFNVGIPGTGFPAPYN